jgi:transcription antitermination factor NusG
MKAAKARCETCFHEYTLRSGNLYINEDEGVCICIPNGCYSKMFEAREIQKQIENKPKLWYVAACEPGKDNRVRRQLLDLAGELQIPSSVLFRVILPKHKVWRRTRTVYKVYEMDKKHVLGFVTAEDGIDEAIYKAKKKFEGKGKRKNPEWREVGKVVLEKKGGELIQRRALTYPGYIIIHMIYNDMTSTLIEKMQRKGLWGLLPLRLPVTAKDPKTGRAISKRPNKREIEDKLYWRPTELKSEEEAIMLIRDKLSKNKATEPEKPKDLSVGDTVKIINGPCKGAEGKITMKGAGRNPELVIEILILGKKTIVKMQWWQVMKL